VAAGKVYDEIRNKPGLAAEFLGERELKNVDRPVSVYSLGSEGAPSSTPMPTEFRCG
jgi:class 3 adenylate cyclase